MSTIPPPSIRKAWNVSVYITAVSPPAGVSLGSDLYFSYFYDIKIVKEKIPFCLFLKSLLAMIAHSVVKLSTQSLVIMLFVHRHFNNTNKLIF